MSRPQDQYLFSYTVDVTVQNGDEFTTKSHENVCCIIETKLGGLLLHDAHAQPIILYASGQWFSASTRNMQPLPPRSFFQPDAVVPDRIGKQA